MIIPALASRDSAIRSRLALRFILTACVVFGVACAVAVLLIRVVPAPKAATEAMLPRVFWLSTALLVAGSTALQRAIFCVKRERQPPFRRWLLTALVLGTAFWVVQTCGLRGLALHQDPHEVQTGANAFLTVIAALHFLHFTAALLLLVWVVVNALADRYDHEYSWGVTFCASFWHALGVVWCLILGAFLIAAG